MQDARLEGPCCIDALLFLALRCRLHPPLCLRRSPPASSAPSLLRLCSGSSVLSSPFPEFERHFNNLWADNADALSLLYSGTGAQKTDFTRTGRRTPQGVVRDLAISLQRWVLGNLEDGRTQDA
jgi:hypothetical protein